MMTELPPKPDSTTGEPRPPRAPTQFGELDKESRPGKLPPPPAGQSATVEYYRPSRSEVTFGSLVGVVFIVLIALWSGGLDALTIWFNWLLALLWVVGYMYASRKDLIKAGVDWVGGTNMWVRTYELTQIRYLNRGSGGVDLELTDSAGRSMVLTLNVLQANHRLWDYVHLGMRHSVAQGAELNRTARAQFPELSTHS